MAVPTLGTSVFSPITSSATTGTVQTTGFPIDLQIAQPRTGTYSAVWSDRLRGVVTTPTNATARTLESSNADAEKTTITATRYWDNTGFQTPTGWSGNSVAFWSFSRRPGFFDTVCYTGTGSATTQAHNLGVVPELIIVKSRSAAATNWIVWNTTLNSSTGYLYLNDTMAADNFAGVWNGAPTSTTFTLGNNFQNNQASSTFVAYLFATCPGVSKVGSYTGTGAARTINCGFTGGARFVLIKATSQSGAWYVWDTARGMVSGTDPRLALNSTAAELNNYRVLTTSTGFQLVTTDATVNASGGSYIFLAIA
jgi:hypothetical protein